MKNSSTLKSSSHNDSPKTPGGISRSLLTPCRRVGLSRNFRKSAVSPFQSPLSTRTEVNQDKTHTRKRKQPSELTPQTPDNVEYVDTLENENVQTPTRKVELPRRKKSKTLLISINKGSEENVNLQVKACEPISNSTKNTPSESLIEKTNSTELDNINIVSEKIEVTPLKSLKSKSKKNVTPSQSVTNIVTDLKKVNVLEDVKVPESNDNKQEVTEEKSPNNLTKECIVVIQKKIFKKQLKGNGKPTNVEKLNAGPIKADIISQQVFDSDDEPLICISKENNKIPPIITIDDDEEDFVTRKTAKRTIDDEDFVPNKPVKTKSKTKSPATKTKSNSKVVQAEIHKPPDSDYSDDEDFFEKKRTILVRKTYEKVTKPHKAKSTGSITQKDIDNIKARIETKKKLLLAKAMTEDTKELRDLIKKWQKGCQDALMELMDLMKAKLPDKQNMDYSEILQNLKIPSSLVGYDSDNDCFLTPDDESIVLAKLN